MKPLQRRQFLQLALSGAALALLNRCVPAAQKSLTPSPAPGISPTPGLLRNENRSGFYIRFIKAIPPPDPTTWQLAIEGLVDHPQTLNLTDLQTLPTVTQRSRLKCVEGWSAPAEWQGFQARDLMDKVGVQPSATWIHFYCADEYYEALPLVELTQPRVLFVYGMNGAALPPEHGGPLRLIAPSKYGYKSPKSLLRLVFSDKERQGYWPTVGPYDAEGEIQPGADYPLDLGTVRTLETHGEISYPDGMESKP